MAEDQHRLGGGEAVNARSIRADVRNPLLQLPAVQALAKLSPECRAAMRGLLRDISADARARADKCWKQHKAPMAAYWKAVAVYANHASRLFRPLAEPIARTTPETRQALIDLNAAVSAWRVTGKPDLALISAAQGRADEALGLAPLWERAA